MGGNFIFRASGARSPFGTSFVSGSHCGNKAYWGAVGGNYSSRTTINIRNYGSGNCCCDGGYYGGYYGGGCCGNGGGISEKNALWALGIGAGVGLLASPLGGPILKGIGWAGKQLWNGARITGQCLWEGGKALVNTFCYAGRGIWNGIRKLFGKEPIENKWETFEMKNPLKLS